MGAARRHTAVVVTTGRDAPPTPIGRLTTPPPRTRDPRGADRAALLDTLRNEPTSFSFFQAVRLLSRLWPQRAGVARTADPGDEVVRFSASTSLAFPPSEIQSLDLHEDEDEQSEPATMTVSFIGLTGPQGVLPHVYTEHAATRARAKDTAFRDFLDIFEHRAIALFYRAWEKNFAAGAHETGAEDRLRDHLLDLSGLGTAGMRNRLPVPDDVLAFYAGVFASRGRTADGLARLVGDYFGVPAEVEQFTGTWRRLDAGGQCTLGAEDDAGRLGFGIMGDAAWDPQGRVRLRLGPLARAQFDAFLPGGAAHEALRALARLYVDDQVGVDAQLVMARGDVPRCTLGTPAEAAATGAPRLGRGTWLTSRAPVRDPDDTLMTLCE
jgi:type VI secretion system protein ImpH